MCVCERERVCVVCAHVRACAHTRRASFRTLGLRSACGFERASDWERGCVCVRERESVCVVCAHVCAHSQSQLEDIGFVCCMCV